MNIDPLMIARFFRNECTAGERERVIAYLDEHPEALEQYLGEAEWMAFKAPAQLPAARSQAMKQAVMDNIQRRPVIKRFPYGRAAAIVLGILLAAGGYVWLQRGNRNAHTNKPVTDAMVLLENRTDSVKPVRMQDGSLIVLDSHSAIRYPRRFAQHRKVTLTGSALFDVTPSGQRPFLVNAGSCTITVLGTRFKVRTGPASQQVRIRLFSGKVRVGAGNRQIDLLPGKELTYNPADSSWSSHPFIKEKPAAPAVKRAPAPAADDNSRQLVFDNQPLTRVLDALQQRFGAGIRYPEQRLRHYYFSGEFREQDSLIHILNTIGALNGLQVKTDSAGYTLLPAGK